jgi:hypothetical protein
MVAATLTIGARARDGEAPFDRLLQHSEVVAGARRALVEGVMLTAVDGFLGRETLDLLGKLRRSFATARTLSTK